MDVPLVTRVYGLKLFLQVLFREQRKDTDLKNGPEIQAPFAEILRLNGNNPKKNITKQSDDNFFFLNAGYYEKKFLQFLVERITRKQRAIYSICDVLGTLDNFLNKKERKFG